MSEIKDVLGLKREKYGEKKGGGESEIVREFMVGDLNRNLWRMCPRGYLTKRRRWVFIKNF